MDQRLKKVNKILEPYYSLLMMLAFFIGLFITAFKLIISPSDLRVTVQNDQISYPNSIGDYYDAIDGFVEDHDTLKIESTTIQGFLLKTTNFKRIILKNTSSKTLRGVKFKLLNADALTAWGVSSDFLTNDEETDLRKNLMFDELRGIVYFKKDLQLPSNSQINISLWGNFKDEIVSSNLIINYDGGDSHIEKAYTINGMKGYFFNYIFEILLFMIFIFIVVFYVGINSSKNKE